jgi:hypothetical protein
VWWNDHGDWNNHGANVDVVVNLWQLLLAVCY